MTVRAGLAMPDKMATKNKRATARGALTKI
jgi:hypothetical protein